MKKEKGYTQERTVIKIMDTWSNISSVRKVHKLLDNKGIDIEYDYYGIRTYGQIKHYSFMKDMNARRKEISKLTKLINEDPNYNHTYFIIYIGRGRSTRIAYVKHWKEIYNGTK